MVGGELGVAVGCAVGDADGAGVGLAVVGAGVGAGVVGSKHSPSTQTQLAPEWHPSAQLSPSFRGVPKQPPRASLQSATAQVVSTAEQSLGASLQTGKPNTYTHSDAAGSSQTPFPHSADRRMQASTVVTVAVVDVAEVWVAVAVVFVVVVAVVAVAVVDVVVTVVVSSSG